MGVFEASMVLALGWFSAWDRTGPLPWALAMHLLQYIPVTAVGLCGWGASGMSLRSWGQGRGSGLNPAVTGGRPRRVSRSHGRSCP